MKRILLTIMMTMSLAAMAQRGHRFMPGMTFRDPMVHDPVMARGEDGRYYVFSTGMGVSVMSSADLDEWRMEKPALLSPQEGKTEDGQFPRQRFEGGPAWAVDSIRGFHGHIWAPDISYHNGLWHLYYSCSTFGKNGSAIGHATTKTLDPTSPDFGWTDHGMVIASHRRRDNYNAIDPNLVVDDNGQPWLTFGSFWDGIQLVRLSADDYQTPQTKPVTIARRVGRRITLEEMNDTTRFTHEGNQVIEAGENAIEAPFILHHGGYYYLFVSHDYCCRGERSTYKTVYGRSTSVEGPYVDEEGRLMTEGGGTLLYGPDAEHYGIGHCAVYNWDGKTQFVSHAYTKSQRGDALLFLRELKFNKKGWISRK